MILNNDYTSRVPIKRSAIKVIGFGGAGCNTICRLSSLNIPGIELIAANTDLQSLPSNENAKSILLGPHLSRGYGSGGDLQIGQKAAEESFRDLLQEIRGANIVFLTAGMGGGTGSGAIQIAARIAKSLDVRTISVVTLPFSFEGLRRSQCAMEATALLQQFTDTLITIPNDHLLKILPADTPLTNAFACSDDLIVKNIQGISGLMEIKETMQIDLSYILRLMNSNSGTYISTGQGRGENRVTHAIRNALDHPLMDTLSMKNAKGIILKMIGNISISEIESAMAYVRSIVAPEAEVIPAISVVDLLDDWVEICILVSGIGAVPFLPNYSDIMNQPDGLNVNLLAAFKDLDSFEFEPAASEIEEIEIPAFLRKGYN